MQLPLNATHVLNERNAKSFCFRLLTDVLTRKSNARQGGPHFGSNSLLYGAKLKSNARGMPVGGRGGFGIDWYITTETVSMQKIISDVMTISIPFVLNKPKISTGQVIVSYKKLGESMHDLPELKAFVVYQD